jgi:prefoldin subunit 5
MGLRAYINAEIARLEAMEREHQAAIRALQDQINAVRGGINAYRDVLAQLNQEEAAHGLDDAGNLD